MDFALYPPEVNSGLMYAGPGPGPLLAAAAAWDAVAAELESAAAGYSSEVSGLTGLAWFGPSSAAMAAAAAPYVGWLQTTAAAAGQTAAQAFAAAAAYEAAFAATVPPPVIAANRAQLAVLVATNFFGQNTPAIAATEAEYVAFWVQDATAMYVYAADSAAASTLTSFQEPSPSTNQAGQAEQARSVAQSAGNATSAHTQTLAQLTTQQAGALAPGDPAIPGGTTATVPAGSTITVGPNSVAFVNGGSITTTTVSNGSVYFASGVSIIVNTNSAVTLDTPAIEGGIPVAAGHTIIANAVNPITLTPAAGYSSVTAYLVNGSATIAGSPFSSAGIANTGAGSATAVVGSSAVDVLAGGTGVSYVAPVAPVVPVVPAVSPGGLVSALGATSSPGLAGTAGIQPQLNAELLMKWAGALPGADLATAAG
ncbi:PPE family protein [Mycobacterium malmoense]|uniref:PPE family protein n=1 Tax=Mycobacterium malmoense TaxID=1780 RepID=UPI0008F90556|nr:PPE family protein [Mycobacterium malmoense]OIN80156.1 hypothetical protein BMG05_14120 [Mycobacterium malmoense]